MTNNYPNMDQIKKEIVRKLVKGEKITLEEAKKIGDPDSIDRTHPIRYIIHENRMISNKGATSNVYDIRLPSKNLAAKIITGYGTMSTTTIVQEIEIQHIAYDKFKNRRIKPPRPEGIYNIYNLSTGRFQTGIVMEKIEGKTLGEMGLRREIADKISRAQEEMLKEVGIIGLHSENYENTIFDEQEKRFRPIDFGYAKLSEELEKEYFFSSVGRMRL